ncbi:MAG TPA: helix-turn-helix domain-containing protein [Thermoplasmata archaeon]|nr:helix-turn-helix domain-containing protein [Thermoplasmata archaeon]
MGQPNGGLHGLHGLLVEHGIPDRGARLYLALCREGPQTAADLARIAGLNRVEAYRFLRQLEGAGLLTSYGRRPSRFAAVPPEAVVDRWIRRASDRLHRLESDRSQILADWQESLAANPTDGAPRFTVLEGPHKIHRFLIQRLGVSREEVRAAVGGFSLARAIDGGVDRALRDASERGVRVRLVTEVGVGNLPEAKHFAEFAEVRHASGPVSNRTVVVDKVGALIYVSGAEGLGSSDSHEVALWSNAPSFQRLARDYHQRLWTKGEKFDRRSVELETPPSAVLPVIRGRESEPIDRLREVTALGMRAAGVEEMMLDLPELIGSIGRQLGREVGRSLEGETPGDVAHSLQSYYAEHAIGRLSVVKDRPLVLRVNDCFACVHHSPEVGRVLCPEMLRAALESRLGARYDVSKPDPRRHAQRGCVFTVTAA